MHPDLHSPNCIDRYTIVTINETNGIDARDMVGESLFVFGILFALLLLASRCLAGLLRVHDELMVVGLLVPLEACEVGLFDLIICLQKESAYAVSRHLSKEVGSCCTFFLYCLCIASSASLIVTPLRFLAVTSSPMGK